MTVVQTHWLWCHSPTLWDSFLQHHLAFWDSPLTHSNTLGLSPDVLQHFVTLPLHTPALWNPPLTHSSTLGLSPDTLQHFGTSSQYSVLLVFHLPYFCYFISQHSGFFISVLCSNTFFFFFLNLMFVNNCFTNKQCSSSNNNDDNSASSCKTFWQLLEK